MPEKAALKKTALLSPPPFFLTFFGGPAVQISPLPMLPLT